jgi:hypothetical protein
MLSSSSLEPHAPEQLGIDGNNYSAYRHKHRTACGRENDARARQDSRGQRNCKDVVALRTSTMSRASTATSVPAPIAIPTSAVSSAGASFTPSPTIATRFRERFSSSILAAFCSGSTSEKTISMPAPQLPSQLPRELAPVFLRGLLLPLAHPPTVDDQVTFVGHVVNTNLAE